MLFPVALVTLIGVARLPAVLGNDGTVACDPALRPVEIDQSGTVFTSLGYNGTAPYPPDQICEYKFIGTAGKNVMLTFDDIVIEECTNCKCDYLEVYDGPDATGNLLAKYCGNVDTPVRVVAGTDAFVRFVSDGSTQGTGFSGTFTIGNAACEGGVDVTDLNGTFTSPNFPLSYDNNADCRWTFKLPDDSYRVEFTFDSFEVEDSCYYDALEMIDGSGRLMSRWFWADGPSNPEVVFSSYAGQGDVDMRFMSDSSIIARGFRGYWQMVQD